MYICIYIYIYIYIYICIQYIYIYIIEIYGYPIPLIIPPFQAGWDLGTPGVLGCLAAGMAGGLWWGHLGWRQDGALEQNEQDDLALWTVSKDAAIAMIHLPIFVFIYQYNENYEILICEHIPNWDIPYTNINDIYTPS